MTLFAYTEAVVINVSKVWSFNTGFECSDGNGVLDIEWK